MKILVVGDPHGSKKVKKIPIAKIKPDVIFVPGDLGKADLARECAWRDLDREKKGLPEIKITAKQQKMMIDDFGDDKDEDAE